MRGEGLRSDRLMANKWREYEGLAGVETQPNNSTKHLRRRRTTFHHPFSHRQSRCKKTKSRTSKKPKPLLLFRHLIKALLSIPHQPPHIPFDIIVSRRRARRPRHLLRDLRHERIHLGLEHRLEQLLRIRHHLEAIHQRRFRPGPELAAHGVGQGDAEFLAQGIGDGDNFVEDVAAAGDPDGGTEEGACARSRHVGSEELDEDGGDDGADGVDDYRFHGGFEGDCMRYMRQCGADGVDDGEAEGVGDGGADSGADGVGDGGGDGGAGRL